MSPNAIWMLIGGLAAAIVCAAIGWWIYSLVTA